MGLIKRQQLEQLKAQEKQPKNPLPKKSSSEQTQNAQHHDPSHHDPAMHQPTDDDDWSWESFLSGDVPDRRHASKRREQDQQDATTQIELARQEADTIRQNAFDAGHTEGLETAQEAIEQLKQQFAQLLEGREQVEDGMVKQMGPLAVAIAEKILKTEVTCDEALTTRLARETMQKAGRDAKSIMIKVHPDQLAMVRAAFREKPPENLHAELSIVDDDTVDWGSCMVETDSGMIDARFSTQLALLQKLLF